MTDRRAVALAAGLLVLCTVSGCAGDSDTRPARAEQRATPEAINGFIGGASKLDTGGLFSEPSDVAVYDGEDDGPADDKIFVAEADAARSARVQRLDGDGNFELAWGQDVVRASSPADTGTGPEICRDARSCKAAPPGSAAGAFNQPTGIAVDDETGAVYVADTGNLRVQQFTLDGEFVKAWGWGVATGAARFELCTADCRAGRHGEREGDGNAGQLAPVDGGGIAVRPGSGDVLVSDGGNSRVLQFSRDGDFVRAWGLGVAGGGTRFEACTTDGGCRAGTAGKPSWVASGGWPRQLAVDEAGVVYATDDQSRSRLLRFDLDEASDDDASDSPLPPIPSGHQDVGDDNMGVDVDSATGRLVAVWNRFGPPVVDFVTDPGADDGGSWSKRRQTLPLGFVQSAYGVAVSPSTGIVYIAQSERLNQLDPSTSFTSCPVPGGGTRTCHGLIVMAAEGPPRARVGPPRRTGATTATLTGAVTAPGAATYRFQTSRDGGPWRDAHAARYSTGADGRRVSWSMRGLEPGARYRVRILLTRLVSESPGVERFVSKTAALGS